MVTDSRQYRINTLSRKSCCRNGKWIVEWRCIGFWLDVIELQTETQSAVLADLFFLLDSLLNRIFMILLEGVTMGQNLPFI